MEHRLFARFYDRMAAAAERSGMRRRRAELLDPLRGTILEIGAGTGLNLEHYHGLEELVLNEPDAAMRRQLDRRLAATRSGFPIRVVAEPLGTRPLPLEDGSMDAVVSTLVLCSVADPAAAVREIRRVLRPGGSLVLVEHVRGHGAVALTQALLTPLQRAVAGGCHLDRRTAETLVAGGFDISGVQPWHLPGCLRFLGPAISGTAVHAAGGVG